VRQPDPGCGDRLGSCRNSSIRPAAAAVNDKGECQPPAGRSRAGPLHKLPECVCQCAPYLSAALTPERTVLPARFSRVEESATTPEPSLGQRAVIKTSWGPAPHDGPGCEPAAARPGRMFIHRHAGVNVLNCRKERAAPESRVRIRGPRRYARRPRDARIQVSRRKPTQLRRSLLCQNTQSDGPDQQSCAAGRRPRSDAVQRRTQHLGRAGCACEDQPGLRAAVLAPAQSR
jgi:hypothetical protein